MTAYCHIESPIGELLIAGDGGRIRVVAFAQGYKAWQPAADWRRDPAAVAPAVEQLAAYFAGELKRFDLALEPSGSPFQAQVWSALGRIPYGRTRTYGDLARAIGRPRAARAVGAANGANPLVVVVPCPRLVGADGGLTGFGGGVAAKAWLLDLESENLRRCA